MSEKTRRRLAVVLVVVATLIGVLALLSTWTKRQVFDTDQWVATSSELLADETIRTQIASDLTSDIFSSGVVQAEVANLLPPKAAPLAGPASAGLSQLFERAVNKLLGTAAVQGLWEEANRAASTTFIAIADDEPIATGVLGKAQSATGSTSLDLTKIKATITEKLGIELPDSGIGSGEAAQAAVEAGDAQAGIEVLAPDEVSTVRDIANLIQKGSVVLLLLTFLLYVIAIAITGGTRLRTVTQVGLSLIIIGFATLMARKLLGTYLVDELAASDSAKPAADAVWEIVTDLLRSMAVATIAYGVVILLGALLAGPTKAAGRVREFIAPALRDPMWAAAGTALAIILLIWWSPTPAFNDPLGIVLVLGLVIAGVVAIRRQVVKEFPATG